MNIKNKKMIDLGIFAISEYQEDHYQELEIDEYFLLDSLKKLMIEHRNKLKEKIEIIKNE